MNINVSQAAMKSNCLTAARCINAGKLECT